MSAIYIPNQWNPRGYQKNLWNKLERGCKRAVAVWHRRAGKDSMSLNWTAVEALKRPGVYWHLAPTQRQVRKIVWDNIDGEGRRIIDQVFPRQIRDNTRDQDMQITLKNGSIWQCVGSDNYDSLVGANPVGVVFSEYSISNPAAWDYVRPILAQNNGWALFIFTPRGPNHAKDLYDMALNDPNWFAEILTVDDTSAISKEAIDQERAAGMSDNMIEQEFYCSFLGVVDGSYYGRIMQDSRNAKKITKVPHDPSLTVTTAWDLGRNDDTAIWFVQQAGFETRVIDFYANSGAGIDHYVKHLQSKNYVYERHIMPHDAGHVQFATNMSLASQARELGLFNISVLPRERNLADEVGIQAVRNLLPKCYFDVDNCKEGIKALEFYHREYDDKRGTFKPNPVHDWSSHAADAFRYLAMGLRDSPSVREHRRRNRQSSAIMNKYSVFG